MSKFFIQDYDSSDKTEKVKKAKPIELSEEEKEQRANALLAKRIDNKVVFGYVAEKGNKKVICKYDKSTEDYIEVDESGKIITSIFGYSIREYQSNKSIYYYGEV